MSLVVNGYEFADWEVANLGFRAVASKGGAKYFLKKYQEPVEPVNNGSLDAKTIEAMNKSFQNFVDLHKRVNSSIRGISGRGGNIIIPCSEFVHDHHFIEVSEFIPGVVPDDEAPAVIAKLSEEDKCLIMKTAAGALHSVHGMKIIHSDLKPKNILLVKNTLGNYVAKLVDFDASYFEGVLPEKLVGTFEYLSPELGRAILCEDDEMRAELAKTLTTKSDIFSLGLIYHVYLTGELPQAINLPEKLQKMKDKGRIIHAYIALSRGADIQISPKIKDPVYRELIADMLKLDYKERPTALEVLNRLKSVGKIKPEVTGGVKEEKKITVPTGFPKGGWPEHDISFDVERLQSRGFVAGTLKESGGVHGYQFYRKDDSVGNFFTIENLMLMRYAVKGSGGHSTSPAPKPGPTPTPAPTPTPTPTPVPTPTPSPVEMTCEPWPGHAIVFDNEVMNKKNVLKIERATMSGVEGYNVYYKGEGAIVRFMSESNLLMMKLAQKK